MKLILFKQGSLHILVSLQPASRWVIIAKSDGYLQFSIFSRGRIEKVSTLSYDISFTPVLSSGIELLFFSVQIQSISSSGCLPDMSAKQFHMIKVLCGSPS